MTYIMVYAYIYIVVELNDGHHALLYNRYIYSIWVQYGKNMDFDSVKSSQIKSVTNIDTAKI